MPEDASQRGLTCAYSPSLLIALIIRIHIRSGSVVLS